MATMAVAFTILPGKADDARRFGEEVAGPRRTEAAASFRRIGVTHEYITAPESAPPERLTELTLTHFGDGGMRATKFQRDEALLLEATAADPANPRYAFYLAQTYFDLRRYAEALSAYRSRSRMPGWDE